VETLLRWRESQTENRIYALIKYLNDKDPKSEGDLPYERNLDAYVNQLLFDRVLNGPGVLKMYRSPSSQDKDPIHAYDHLGTNLKDAAQTQGPFSNWTVHIATVPWEAIHISQLVLDHPIDIRIGFTGGDCHLVINYRESSYYVRNENSLKKFISATAPFIKRADLF